MNAWAGSVGSGFAQCLMLLTPQTRCRLSSAWTAAALEAGICSVIVHGAGVGPTPCIPLQIWRPPAHHGHQRWQRMKCELTCQGREHWHGRPPVKQQPHSREGNFPLKCCKQRVALFCGHKITAWQGTPNSGSGTPSRFATLAFHMCRT